MKCQNCGEVFATGERFCGECGQARPEMAPGFLEAELRFQEIQRLRRTGEMGETEYEEALRQLVLYERDSFWMLGADSGAWYRLEGEQWVPGDPPLASGRAAAPVSEGKGPTTPGSASPPRKRLLLGLLIGVPVALALLIGLLAIFTPYPRMWVQSATILLSSDDADNYFERALIYRYDLEDLEAATDDVSAAIEVAPNAFYYEWRAEVYAERGELARAAADYTQSILLNPTLADLYADRAGIYQQLGEPVLALADLDQAIQMNADDCYFFLKRADLRLQEGNVDQARQDYERVLAFPADGCLWRAEAETGLSGLGGVASAPAAAATETPAPTVPAATGTPVPIPTVPTPTATPTTEPTATSALTATPTQWMEVRMGRLSTNIYVPPGWTAEVLEGGDYLYAADEDEICTMFVDWYLTTATSTLGQMERWLATQDEWTWGTIIIGSSKLADYAYSRGDRVGFRSTFAVLQGPLPQGAMILWSGQAPASAWDDCVALFQEMIERAAPITTP